MEKPNRKTVRLPGYDYGSPGYYFITICTKDKQNLLCKISEPPVGTVALDGPLVQLSDYGKIVENQLESFRSYYSNIKITSYVIMPNHVHLLLYIPPDFDCGPSRATVPTGAAETMSAPKVSTVGRFIGTIKRFCNREIGRNVWQSRSHDEIIKNESHLYGVEDYIAANPSKWLEDEHYVAD